MRQYEIIITPASENDLQEIFRYIATELLEPRGTRPTGGRPGPRALEPGKTPGKIDLRGRSSKAFSEPRKARRFFSSAI